jgi:hypothetical protein
MQSSIFSTGDVDASPEICEPILYWEQDGNKRGDNKDVVTVARSNYISGVTVTVQSLASAHAPRRSHVPTF